MINQAFTYSSIIFVINFSIWRLIVLSLVTDNLAEENYNTQHAHVNSVIASTLPTCFSYPAFL